MPACTWPVNQPEWSYTGERDTWHARNVDRYNIQASTELCAVHQPYRLVYRRKQPETRVISGGYWLVITVLVMCGFVEVP